MTAKLTTRVTKHTLRSEAAQVKFMRAIRGGKISGASTAAELFDVTEATIWNWVANARRNGQRIATRTGGAWELLK